MRHAPCELLGEAGRRLADQIGLADAREEARERGDAAGLRLAAGDPENIAEASKRLGGRIRVGGLGIVDEEDGVAANSSAASPIR